MFGSKKAIRTITAVLLASFLPICAACDSVTAPIQAASAAHEIADEYFPGNRNTLEAWKNADMNKVVASVKDPEHIPFMDITFREFFDEYMYYLAVYGITDDMSEEYAQSCETYRVNIINYLTFEKMFLYSARKDYGLSAESLTPEQLEKVKENALSVRKDWATNFYAAASEKLGENADEESIEKLCGEVLDEVLKKCGIDYDMFYNWELNSMVQDLALDEMLKGVSTDENAVKEELEAIREEAREAAENDPVTYESTPVYSLAYVPEGARLARHITFAIEDTGMSFEQQKLAREIGEQLENGGDFAALSAQYGGQDSHIVLNGSGVFEKNYVGALYGIKEINGVSNPVVCGDSVYVIQYLGEAKITPEDTARLTAQITEYLKSSQETDIQVETYGKWNDEYDYEIDCDTLMISPADVIAGISPDVLARG